MARGQNPPEGRPHHGVAAIQLGEKKRMFAMRKPFNSENIIIVINPTIVRPGPKFSIRPEGCLSMMPRLLRLLGYTTTIEDDTLIFVLPR